MIVPYFGDQPFWAEHVHQLGASPAPIPRLKLSAQKLADALQEATQDEQINSTAGRLGDQIHAENGVSNAVKLIESYLHKPEQLMRFNP